MVENYDSVVAQMREAGLVVDEGLEIGVLRRARTVDHPRERRGWYILHEVTGRDGRRLLVGTFGVWRGNDNGAIKVRLDRSNLTKDQIKAINARIAEDRKRAAAARKRRAEAAARRAAAAWRKAERSGESEYLGRKGVGAHGVRFTESGCVIVPMQDAAGSIHGLQFILPKDHPRRKKTGRDKEYWPRGLVKRGHWFQIGSIRDLVLLAEGYATGATLHEATGLPVAVAFDANNLLPVAQAIHERYPAARILVCADDDYVQTCRHCKKRTKVETPQCEHCGREHGKANAGVEAAKAAALAVGGAWIKPAFSEDRQYQKFTDFNDLQQLEGRHVVRGQVESALDQLGWRRPLGGAAPRGAAREKGDGGKRPMAPKMTIDEAVARYWGTYGLGGEVLFDEVERRLVHKRDVANLLPRHGIDEMRAHPDWRVARDWEIGFDPTESDPDILCNLYAGWPTTPKEGECQNLLDLLYYLCSNEPNREEVYEWILKWLAYPIQHPGAKMHSAIVVHGPQGTGKSRFFEAYAKIYGEYGRVLGQEALEDKFNADWAEKKLFILADEVLARTEMFHVKNRLKGFITGDTIRVNPKNLPAHNERNHMNIVFLSNERQPLVLENDDRRHCVIWVPPKLPDSFFRAVDEEIDNGGIEALHHYLLRLDLGDFKPWAKPPATTAKADLIQSSASSEERFVEEWVAGELENADGEPIPLCPCLGSTLYALYERWCRQNGERFPRPRNQFINYLKKRPGWSAGKSERTLVSLNSSQTKNRKMVVPSEQDLILAARRAGEHSMQQEALRQPDETKAHWLTRGYFLFENAVGVAE